MTIHEELEEVKRALTVRAADISISRPLAAYLLAQVHYVERLALCPGHRDKTTGRCIACQAERTARIEVSEYGKDLALDVRCGWLDVIADLLTASAARNLRRRREAAEEERLARQDARTAYDDGYAAGRGGDDCY